MINPNIQVRTVPIAANATTPVAIAGSNLLLVSSTGTFNFSLDGGPYQTGLTIMALSVVDPSRALAGSGPIPLFSGPQQFTEILLQDTSGAANSVTLVASNAPILYYNPIPSVVSKDAPTYPKGSGVKVLAAAASDTYNGVDAATGKTRKQIVVTNQDLANVLYCLDSANNVLLSIPAQQAETLPTSGVVKVNNPNGGNISYVVGELFYL